MNKNRRARQKANRQLGGGHRHRELAAQHGSCPVCKPGFAPALPGVVADEAWSAQPVPVSMADVLTAPATALQDGRFLVRPQLSHAVAEKLRTMRIPIAAGPRRRPARRKG